MSMVVVGQAELCKQEVFRQIEDRPVLKQRTRFMREHHIFEKTYVREVRTALTSHMCNWRMNPMRALWGTDAPESGHMQIATRMPADHNGSATAYQW